MLYCSDKPPVQALEMPLFIGALLTGSTFKLLVGDLVAEFAGQQERARPADRDVAETLAEIESSGWWSYCRHCPAPRRSMPLAPVRAMTRWTPTESMNSCSALT